MIEYIIHEQYKTYVYQTDSIEIFDKSNLSIVKQICLRHLFTYEGYLKAVKKYFNYRYRIPIYIHEGLQLFSSKRIKDYDNIWINLASVDSYTFLGNRVILTFTSHRQLIITWSRISFQEQIKRLNAIKFHISKHFHGLDYRK